MLIINKLKKQKKFILATVTALIAIIGISQISKTNSVYANQKFDAFSEILDDFNTIHSWELRTTITDGRSISTDVETYLYNESTGEIIYAALGISENGELFEIPLDEYQLMVQEEHQNLIRELEEFQSYFISEKEEYTVHDGEASPYFTTGWSYREFSNSTSLRNAERVTPHVIGPATITNGQSVTFTHEFGGNLNFTASAQSAIEVGAGFTWNRSASTESNFSQTFNVPTNRRMAVYFSPRYNVTSGFLTERFLGGGEITHQAMGFSPRRVGAFADGVFELRES